MKSRYLLLTLLYMLFLAVIQVAILNNIRLFHYFIPIIYLYPLFKLPLFTPRWLTLLYGTFAGAVIDAFMNTPGLNMASCLLAAFVRQPVLQLIMGDDLEEADDLPPSFRTMRVGRYALYSLLMLLIHIGSLLLLEAYSLSNILRTLPYIGGSLLLSWILLIVLDAFGGKARQG